MAIRSVAMSMVLALGSVFAVGCGGGNARCDMRPSTPQCTDWRGSISPVWVTQEALCRTLGSTSAGGTFAAGATCPTEEMWGGCQATQGDGSKQTNWYYKSQDFPTEASAQQKCDNKMTWVPPQ